MTDVGRRVFLCMVLAMIAGLAVMPGLAQEKPAKPSKAAKQPPAAKGLEAFGNPFVLAAGSAAFG